VLLTPCQGTPTEPRSAASSATPKDRAAEPPEHSPQQGGHETVCYCWKGDAAEATLRPETTKLLRLVIELAGYGATPEHPRGRAADVPEELRLRRPYYAAYHARGHLSYAELDLEETPTDL
jgi:hypothetical protein